MMGTLWSFLKILALLAAIGWLWLHPGTVTLQWEEWNLDLPVTLVALGLASLLTACIFLTHLWIFLRTLPTRYHQRRELQRLQEGYSSLTQGYAALTAHDLTHVHQFIQQTQKKLGEVPLLLYLKATAARLEQDNKGADFFFKKLAQLPTASALGVIPLLEKAQQEENLPLALETAQKALELDPKASWILERILTLQLKAELTSEAEKTLTNLTKIQGKKALIPYRQGLYLAQRDQALRQGNGPQAFKLAKKAYELNPSHLPAALALAREWGHLGKKSKSISILSQAWKEEPSPLLIDLFCEVAAGASSPDQNAWCEELIFMAPDHPLSHQLRQRVAQRDLSLSHT
jgi:HemY protein